jgi:hypothetical protein
MRTGDGLHFIARAPAPALGGDLAGVHGALLALAIYRSIERDAERAVAKRLPQLLALIRPDAGAEL